MVNFNNLKEGSEEYNQNVIALFTEKKSILSNKISIISPKANQIELYIEKGKVMMSLDKNSAPLIYNTKTGKFYLNLKNKKEPTFLEEVMKYTVGTINRGYVPFIKRPNFIYPFISFASLEINGLYLQVLPQLESHYFDNGELLKEINIYTVELIIEESILQRSDRSVLDINRLNKKLGYSHVFKKKEHEDDPLNSIAIKFGPVLTSYLASFDK